MQLDAIMTDEKESLSCGMLREMASIINIFFRGCPGPQKQIRVGEAELYHCVSNLMQPHIYFCPRLLFFKIYL